MGRLGLDRRTEAVDDEFVHQVQEALAGANAYLRAERAQGAVLGNTYTSDANGVAEIGFTMSGYSLMDEMPVAGRTLVVHSSTDRIGCGLIK